MHNEFVYVYQVWQAVIYRHGNFLIRLVMCCMSSKCNKPDWEYDSLLLFSGVRVVDLCADPGRCVQAVSNLSDAFRYVLSSSVTSQIVS